MTIQEALSLAEKFIDRYNGKIPSERNYKWGFDNMIEFTECYYFNFIFLHLNGEPNTEPHVAGAPGFMISKYDGYAKIISHVDLHQLQDEEKRMDDLFALAINVKENKAGLDTIKSTYKLNTRQLLQFLKVLQQESFTRLTVTAKLQEIIRNIRTHKYPE